MLLELTLIALARSPEPAPSDAELTNEDIEALPMIGDVDLFFKNSREDPEFEVECEVMIDGRCSSPSSYHRISLLITSRAKCELFPPTSCRFRVLRPTARTCNARSAPVVRV